MAQSTLTIIIIFLSVISFALEKIPLSMTAMLAALAMGITGVIPIKDIYSSFGASATIFVAAMMIVGNALFENGVTSAMGEKIFKTKVAQNERVFIVIVTTFAFILSAICSNSAVVAMVIPLIGAIAIKSKGVITNKNTIMAAGMAAAAGGVCTLAGSTPQMIGQGIFQNAGIPAMGFFDLGKAGLPLCLIMIIYFATFGYSIMKKSLNFEDVSVIDVSSEENKSNNTEIPKYKTYLTTIITLGCVIGFVAGVWDITTVALLGATALIVTRCIGFKEALAGVDWNTIIILGASQAFAKGMVTSGAGEMIAEGCINFFGVDSNPIIILSALIVITVILTNFMSNAAIASMLIPIAINIATGINANPATFGIAVIIACQLALATPVGTPCVTQTLVGGYKYKHYVIVGLPITLIMTIAAIIIIPAVYGW
ncbi:sodium-dependent dicarboxylate transporter SdcS [Clostridium homopropionicum DSM 5847]|uniref:Sodium-dependent dicarboxylate transporter SdcS n=1 Tax=Clostridium homopropionicum DSM 5847 TaxID=1121318 RepID=A0A0L6Z9T0_9CLOT|nr:SLC13 family permease [Clostridium homopropionicum]KOA19721.1 sodium-dependent dicarboxylate transporter SdcS [Clostridium homopropionicum DSM 5847]SFF79089.1 Di-and tricarboxylate transporter [Clostridium homopropionicum]